MPGNRKITFHEFCESRDVHDANWKEKFRDFVFTPTENSNYRVEKEWNVGWISFLRKIPQGELPF